MEEVGEIPVTVRAKGKMGGEVIGRVYLTSSPP